MNNEDAIRYVENGKQIGVQKFYNENKSELIVTAAIQKHAGSYKAFLSELEYLPEKSFFDDGGGDNYRIFECKIFSSLSDALLFIKEKSGISLEELSPRKGKPYFCISIFY
ncbi:hypothetical protein [Hahella sp. HN01]|uniref:hypothetical protein n=1 Tax=Hahella sp. HN01 TaxID=2847262 RepID=UPI001C1E8F81|nr:hypothetical protein [Hahella sp. HN01]MBU6955950.1 hypothetical protein [Hahella sp. HN01]